MSPDLSTAIVLGVVNFCTSGAAVLIAYLTLRYMIGTNCKQINSKYAFFNWSLADTISRQTVQNPEAALLHRHEHQHTYIIPIPSSPSLVSSSGPLGGSQQVRRPSSEFEK